MTPPFHAIVVAAGAGRRFGVALPKQFVAVAGRPLLAWTLERLAAAGAASLTVALPAGHLDRAAGLIAAAGIDLEPHWLAGGASRQETVALSLAACPAADGELVLVHDGARAAVDPADVRAAVAAAAESDGAVLGRPLADTLKRLEAGAVAATVDRAGLFRAETPQVFRRRLLARALARAVADGFAGTDESSLVERLAGVRIVAVAASRPNPKLTEAADLPLLARLLAADRGDHGDHGGGTA